ncbi:MAG: V-type ATPase subunit [archaeon]
MDITIPFIVGAAGLAGVAVIAPATKYALDIYPHLYANTRCASRSGSLLSKKVFEELLAATSTEELFALLEDTYYGGIVEHSREFFGFSAALERDFYRTYRWLATIVPEKLVPVIKAVKMRFEVADIKRALNDLKSGRDIRELEFVENYDLRLKIEGSKDFQSLVVAVEDSEYAQIFQTRTMGDLGEINTLLDKHYVAALIKAIGLIKDKESVAPFQDYARTLVDLYNVRLMVRRIRAKSDEPLIVGGNMDPGELAGITDPVQLESTLSNGRYGEYIGTVTNINVENGLYKCIFELAKNAAAKYTIKSGTVVRFMLLKEIEVRNLNTVIKLKTENFSADEIRPNLVM